MSNKSGFANKSFHGHGCSEPIGLEYIASNLVARGFCCSFAAPNELTVAVDKSEAVISLLSGITSDYASLVDSARIAKSKGRIVAVGGYHACGRPNDFSADLFDYVVIGEGEEAAAAIAEAQIFERTLDIQCLERVEGFSRRVLKAKRIQDLDALPNPLRSQDRLAPYMVYDLMWPPASRQFNTAIVLGSRGCGNSCSFCASETVWGQGVRFRTPEKIVVELSELKSTYNTNVVVFIDQSMGQAKQWSLDLCAAIEKARLGLNWYHQSNMTIDRSVIEAMAMAGCTKIGFGIEGISARSIAKLKPMNSHDIETINSLFDYCNSLGIFVKGYLMIGFPWETDDIVREYSEWISRLRANQVKISYFTPFPGTRDWAKYEERLNSKDWSDFDTVKKPVVHNPNIGVEKYHEIRTHLFRAFYGSPTYSDVTHQMLSRYPHYAESYREYAAFLRSFDMISGEEEWLSWFGNELPKRPHHIGLNGAK